MLEISHDRTQATHWNAGLPDTIVFRGHRKNRIPSCMVPLGILKNADTTSPATRFSLAPGDRLYIFSDGLIEARDAQHTLFGIDRLEAFLEQIATGEHDLNDLLTLLNAYTGSSLHEDDITIAEVQI